MSLMASNSTLGGGGGSTGGSLDRPCILSLEPAFPRSGWLPVANPPSFYGETVQPAGGDWFAASAEAGRLLRMSATGEVLGDWRLQGLRRVDALLGTPAGCWLWDGLAGRASLFQLDPAGAAPIPLRTVPLPPFARIVRALVLADDRLLLLDRGLGLLRIWDGEGRETGTVGRRLSGQGAAADPSRVGFEFPEDLLLDNETIWVSDTGNQRLVSLNREFEPMGTIPLPDSPRRFTGKSADFLAVTAPDGREFLVAKKYGLVGEWPPAVPAIDPGTPVLAPDGSLLALDEQGGLRQRPPLSFPPLAEWLARPGLELANLSRLLEEGETTRAGELALACGGEVLLAYRQASGDALVAKAAATIAKKAGAECQAEHARLESEIRVVVSQVVTIVRDLVGHPDPETAQVEREVAAHALKGAIVRFQDNLAAWRRAAAILEELAGAGWGELPDRWRRECETSRQELARVLAAYDLPAAEKPFVTWWLAAESLRAVPGGPIETLPFDRNLVLTLDGYFSTLARLALHLGLDQEVYDRLIEEELARFPDRDWLIFERLGHWIERGKFESVERQLNHLANQDRENVHLYWSRLLAKQGKTTEAAAHLKRELELYPTRAELVPELVRLGVMQQGEIDNLLMEVTTRGKPDKGFWLGIAQAYLAVRRSTSAIECFEREITLFPENHAAKLALLTHLSSVDCHYPRLPILLSQFEPKSSRENLLAAKICFSCHDFLRCRPYFIKALIAKDCFPEILQHLELFECLDASLLDPGENGVLLNLLVGKPPIEIHTELDAFLSLAATASQSSEKWTLAFSDLDKLLGAHSTQRSVWQKCQLRVQDFIRLHNYEGALSLIGIMLKYRPQDESLKMLIDSLPKSDEKITSNLIIKLEEIEANRFFARTRSFGNFINPWAIAIVSDVKYFVVEMEGNRPYLIIGNLADGREIDRLIMPIKPHYLGYLASQDRLVFNSGLDPRLECLDVGAKRFFTLNPGSDGATVASTIKVYGDSIFVAEPYNHCLTEYDSSGSLTRRIDLADKFWLPYTFCRSESGIFTLIRIHPKWYIGLNPKEKERFAGLSAGMSKFDSSSGVISPQEGRKADPFIPIIQALVFVEHDSQGHTFVSEGKRIIKAGQNLEVIFQSDLAELVREEASRSLFYFMGIVGKYAYFMGISREKIGTIYEYAIIR